MKKLMLVFAVTVISLSACKKNYTCDCTSTIKDSSGSTYGTDNESASIPDEKEKEAQDKCDAMKASLKSDLDETTDVLSSLGAGTFTGQVECTLAED